ncbi:MAG: acylphosphatase [Gemmatimonadetes bacterium]|nr:MAG: acylphosphatase [Gemmatimonadota bacterium]
MGTRRFLVYGRVQGVGFRWFVWREAERLGLGGFVRNLRDGSVEVIAAGPPQALEALEHILGLGPAQSRVERVESSEVPHELMIPNDFDIR